MRAAWALAAALVWLAPPATCAATAKSPSKTAASPAKSRRRAKPVPKITARQRVQAAAQVSEWTSRATPIENPDALSAFFTRLAGADAGGVRVLQYGDSHTAADSFSGVVRLALQQQYGDGGLGFGFAGRPFIGYRRLGSPATESKKWKAEGLTRGAGQTPFGLGGVTLTTRAPGETLSLHTSCSHFELHFLRHPDAGRLEIYVDGAVQTTVDTSGEPGPGNAAVEVPDGEHTFQVRTLDRRPVWIWGWVTGRARGVTYENLGINGAQASIMLLWDETAHINQLEQRAPALVVLAYGTNEAGAPDWTADGYHQSLSAAVGRIRKALPEASVLLLGPPDRARRRKGAWIALDRLDTIIGIQRKVAWEQNAAFWDQRSQMGGAGSMHTWYVAGLAQGDHVHLTEAGYTQLGHLFAGQLMESRLAGSEVSARARQSLPLNGQKSENPRNPPQGH